MTGQQPADIAERVLLVLTRYHVVGDDHVSVLIHVSPHDARVIGNPVLWGRRVIEADWVADGHPEVEITVAA